MGRAFCLTFSTTSLWSKNQSAAPTLIYIVGLLALTGGLAILNAHRAWTADWRVVVTVLGWLMVIGGVFRIVLPRLTAGLAAEIDEAEADNLAPALWPVAR